MRRSLMVAGITAVLSVSGVGAQEAPASANQSAQTGSLQQRLRPPTTPIELAPRLTERERAELRKADAPAKPAAAVRGRDAAYMLAGGALFVAGILAGGQVGALLMLAGAGVGAYGIYLHFR